MASKLLAVASLATLPVLISACAPSGGPGTYEISSKGLSIEVQIPAEPEGELLRDILDYAMEMGVSEDITWASIQVSNGSDMSLYLCEITVLGESGQRFGQVSPGNLVSDAMNLVPQGETENYNRGVDLIIRTLDTNRVDYLPGESAEFYVGFIGDASNPSAVFGGTYSGDLTDWDCDNRASKKN